MIPLIAAGIGALGGVAGSAISAGGAASAQEAANKAAAEEAQRNREFQEKMSSTAVRRYADDLAAAGFNRILAAGGGQASTPSGAVAPVGAVNKSAGLGAGISGGISSALSAAQTISQVQAQEAAAQNALAQGKQAIATAKLTEMKEPIVKAEADIAAKLAGSKVSQAELARKRAEFDSSYVELDSTANRIGQGVGIATDLVNSAMGMKRMGQQIKNMKLDRVIRGEQHLKNQGIHGTSIKDAVKGQFLK